MLKLSSRKERRKRNSERKPFAKYVMVNYTPTIFQGIFGSFDIVIEDGWIQFQLLDSVVDLDQSNSFVIFYPLSELGPIPSDDIDQIIRRAFNGNCADYTCLLNPNWQFEEIERRARMSVGYEFEGRKHASVAEIILKALYDLERSVGLLHPDASADAMAKFWTSWNFQRHLAEFAYVVQCSSLSKALARNPVVVQFETAAGLVDLGSDCSSKATISSTDQM